MSDTVDDFLSRPTPRTLDIIGRSPGPFMVLGAGGKIGLHLSTMLREGLNRLKRDDQVIAVSRFSTLHDRVSFEQRGIKTISCDLTNPNDLEKLPDAPTVFFLAGVKFGTASAPELLHAINVRMPQSVAAKFRQSRIVAFSSGCVYPFVAPITGGASEATRPSPVGAYAASCLAREQAFATAAEQYGNRVVLIRLNYATEFRYGVLVDIAKMVLNRKPIDLTTGHVNVIWQTDAVAHSIQALDVADTSADPINITGAEILPVRELAQHFGGAFRCAVETKGCEADTAWLSNASKSHRLFGLPDTSIEQMVEWTSAWLRAGGQTWDKPTGFERRDGNF